MTKPLKETVKAVLDELNEEDLPDGAYWAMAHDMLDLEYGEVFSIIANDPAYFGYKEQSK